LKNQNKVTESLLTKYWPDENLAEDILDGDKHLCGQNLGWIKSLPTFWKATKWRQTKRFRLF
jgi:hypothetical protein